MKLATAVLLSMMLSTSGASLLRAQEQSKCGPQTKVCTADFLDAAGAPSYECKEAIAGEKVRMTKDESGNGAIVCGPGTFHFSPMQCAGDKFEYKKASEEIVASSWEGGINCPEGGKKVTFPYTMACYSVEC